MHRFQNQFFWSLLLPPISYVYCLHLLPSTTDCNEQSSTRSLKVELCFSSVKCAYKMGISTGILAYVLHGQNSVFYIYSVYTDLCCSTANVINYFRNYQLKNIWLQRILVPQRVNICFWVSINGDIMTIPDSTSNLVSTQFGF